MKKKIFFRDETRSEITIDHSIPSMLCRVLGWGWLVPVSTSCRARDGGSLWTGHQSITAQIRNMVIVFERRERLMMRYDFSYITVGNPS